MDAQQVPAPEVPLLLCKRNRTSPQQQSKLTEVTPGEGSTSFPPFGVSRARSQFGRAQLTLSILVNAPLSRVFAAPANQDPSSARKLLSNAHPFVAVLWLVRGSLAGMEKIGLSNRLPGTSFGKFQEEGLWRKPTWLGTLGSPPSYLFFPIMSSLLCEAFI